MPIGCNSYPRSILLDSHWEALYEASDILLDEIMNDLQSLAGGIPVLSLIVVGYLPRQFLTRYDEGFLRRFLMCAASVGLKMRLPGLHALGCTAEEIALRIMIDNATAVLDDRGEDIEFGDWEDFAFEDTDHRWLWDPRFDGIGSSDDTAFLGVANLRYEEWFVPFSHPRVMHPYADMGPVEPWEEDRAVYEPEDTGEVGNTR